MRKEALTGGLAMSNQPHRGWEIPPETQRKLTVGIALVAALVVFINLIGGPGPNIWDLLQPDGVVHRLAMIRF